MLLLWGALVWLLPRPASAEFEIFKRDVDLLTNSEVRATSVFERVPPRGFLPVKIKIRNGFAQPRNWTVTFHSQPQYGNRGIRFLSSYTVTTPASSETEHAFLVPLASKLDRGVEGELQISVRSGRLLAQGDHPGLMTTDWHSVAFSKGLAGLNNLEELTKAVEARGSLSAGGQPLAATFAPAEVPVDWRALSGFDSILMSNKEWDALEPALRETFSSWVRLGGQLHLFGTEAAQSEKQLGMGRISSWPWDGLKLPVNPLAPVLDASPSLIKSLREDYQTNPVQAAFGEKDFNPLLVFLILAVFAVVVGPVNLQVWAKPGQRHRLFITTPLISLAASLILLVIILLGDGFGGSGRRVGFLLLRSQPEERLAHLIQEQIARTGVLAGRQFAASETSWFSPVVMKRSRWTHFDDPYAMEANFQQADGQIGGDWFRSRSEQMHLVRAAMPTRARIEVIAPGADGQPPQLFNSLGYGLKSFHYQDAAGKFWRSGGAVPSGKPIELEPIPAKEYKLAWEKIYSAFSKTWDFKLSKLSSEPNQFLAEADSPSSLLIPSLRSIRWRDDRLFVAGEPVNRSATAP